MSDFTAALHHNPHPMPSRRPPRRTILDAAAVAVAEAVLGAIGKTRTLTKSDFKLVV